MVQIQSQLSYALRIEDYDTAAKLWEEVGDLQSTCDRDFLQVLPTTVPPE